MIDGTGLIIILIGGLHVMTTLLLANYHNIQLDFLEGIISNQETIINLLNSTKIVIGQEIMK